MMLVQIDKLEVIVAIKEFLLKISNSIIIKRITQPLKNMEGWSLEHVPRKENNARLIFNREESLQLFIALHFDSF